MKANDLLDMIGESDDSIIEEAKKRKKTIVRRWTKGVAVAACLCIVVVGSFNTLQRFDYFKGAGCSAMLGNIVEGFYYYKVDHSGVWRYSDGKAEKVLSTYWEDGWLVNRYGLYYSYDKAVYRMDLETLKRKKIFSTTEGTHIGFDLTNDGNIIVTVYDKNAEYAYQVLISGETGEEISTLTEEIPYRNTEQLYTNTHYQVGERQIVLNPIDVASNEGRYMPTENGNELLSEGSWVRDYSVDVSESVISFGICKGDNIMDTEKLILFADGDTLIVPSSFNYSGSIGHVLLYVDNDDSENYGTNRAGIWCYDTDNGDRWQLKIDSESEFYAFTNDDEMLYSCVPWGEEQTAWKIVYEGNRPVFLQLIDNNIIE